MMGESNEVFLLMPRHNGTTAATATINIGSGVCGIGGMNCGIDGCIGGHSCV
jgi:hypothetical protein